MKARNLILTLAIVAIALAVLPSSHAVSTSNFTLDKSSYNPGDSGKATVIVNNDQASLIRITGIDLSFNYYYSDGRVYTQDFTSPNLSMNVSSGGNSQPITVQFQLPSNIAVGYFTPNVQISYNVLLNTGQFGGNRQANNAATAPVLVASTSAQTIEYLFVATTVMFAVIAGYFAMRFFAVKAPANRSRDN